MTAMAPAIEETHDAERGPTRRCIATGQSRPVGELVRFVEGPDGAIVPDLEGRLPGRGVWVTANQKALARVAKGGLFAKALKKPVAVPADLAAQVERGLARRLANLFGLARRAGLIVAGFGNVEAALSHPKRGARIVALLEASDGAADGERKIVAAARRAGLEIPVLRVLPAAEMGLALGLEHVVHAALFAGGLAQTVVNDAARLRGIQEHRASARHEGNE